jgi:hypothetical protein
MIHTSIYTALLSFSGTCPAVNQCSSSYSHVSHPKSRNGNTPLTINFKNCASETITLWWYDYSGRSKRYATIEPNQEHNQKTHLTHPWTARVSTNSRQVMSINGCSVFYPKSDGQEAVIGESCEAE